MGFYISTKFGFVSGFVIGENYEGEQVLKARHCIDVREAKSYTSRGVAEAAYKKCHAATWWHCVLSSERKDLNQNECPEPFKGLLLCAAEKLDGDEGDDELATEIYNALGS